MHTQPLRSIGSAMVVAALAAAPLAAQAPAAPAAPQVSVTGVAYLQYAYQDAPVHTNSFDVTRAYVNVLGRFANGINTRVTVDVYRLAPDNSLQYRLKYAFFSWTPTGSNLTYKLGLIHTPLVDWEEALWDYRMQGAIALDRNGYLTSADFGAGIDGKWNNDQVNGQLTVVNGEGYSGGTGDFRKDIQARLSVRLQPTNDASRVGGLRVTGYTGVGKFTGGTDRNRYVGMLSYRSQQITLAGEFSSIKDAAITRSLVSAFGVYHFNGGKVAAIARVDLRDPDTNTSNDRDTRIIAGLSYQLSPNVRLLADLDRLSFQSGATARNTGLLQAQFTF